MIISILGRQPAIGVAELERVNGSDAVSWFSDISATVDVSSFDIQRYGSIVKSGRVVAEITRGDWRNVSMKLVKAYQEAWHDRSGKITLGISAYGFDGISSRDVQKTGLVLKQKLRKNDVSLRLVPNADLALSSATSHHNKLGLADNKVELLVVRAKNGKVIIAESLGTQNITALAARDQGRPKRDAFVGMLPPKLALTMINLSGITKTSNDNPNNPTPTILDPFCGTGVVLQEAALLGFSVYGSDLSEKMVRYSRDNINWLADSQRKDIDWYLHEGDAMTADWRTPIDAVVAETYLGQPFSAPPSDIKLKEVRGNCNHIISSFLKNIGQQINPGTPLCLAVPAWRDAAGRITRLPIIDKLDEYGYEQIALKNVSNKDLIYYREDQVVARELLILVKK